jgi:hypothetical protein
MYYLRFTLLPLIHLYSILVCTYAVVMYMSACCQELSCTVFDMYICCDHICMSAYSMHGQGMNGQLIRANRMYSAFSHTKAHSVLVPWGFNVRALLSACNRACTYLAKPCCVGQHGKSYGLVCLYETSMIA